MAKICFFFEIACKICDGISNFSKKVEETFDVYDEIKVKWDFFYQDCVEIARKESLATIMRDHDIFTYFCYSNVFKRFENQVDNSKPLVFNLNRMLKVILDEAIIKKTQKKLEDNLKRNKGK